VPAKDGLDLKLTYASEGNTGRPQMRRSATQVGSIILMLR